VVVRLGTRPGHGTDLAGAGYRRILQGQSLHLHTVSNAVVTLRAWVRVVYDDGTGQLLTVPETPRSASRLSEDLASTDVIVQNGWVVNAEVEMSTADIKRGQTYVRLTVEPFGAALLSDYCFSEFGHVSLGTFVQTGPGGGSGHLQVVTVKANGPPAAETTRLLALSNTIRKVYSFVWYYIASADVDSRILTVRLRDVLGALPTGLGVINVWFPPTLTLTASELGAIFGDPKRTGSNDNLTVVIDDAASAPSPFPLLIEEGDPGFLIFLITDSNVNDFDTIYLLQEEWVVL